MIVGERVAAGARATLGAPFRIQGRDPAGGLDCVGVVEVAVRAAGPDLPPLPAAYRLRCGRLPRHAIPAGVRRCVGDRVGDILLFRLSPAQLHLAVRSDHGIIHADALARRVVERAGPPPWPIVAAWRVDEDAFGRDQPREE